MTRLGIAACALVLLASVPPAWAQNSAADFLRQAEAVDRALGPFAELSAPPRDADAATPPPELPEWLWRQPYDQQPFFATRPGSRRCTTPTPGGPAC